MRAHFFLAAVVCGIRTLDGTAQNDDCTGAVAIGCGTSITDSTTSATDDVVDDCGTTITAPGVWYDLVGTGGWVTLSTCGGSTDYDTKLNVYTGDCSAPACLTGDDDGPLCDLASDVIFFADAGTTYHVLVQGYNALTGVFTLTVGCMNCAPPQDILISPSDVAADIYWTSLNSGSDFNIEYGPAGFIPGSGTSISGTVGIDGPPAHIIGLTADSDYDVYITEACAGGGISPAAGPYPFTTLLDPPPPNTFCGDAQPITCGATVDGTTTGAILTPAPTCASANVNTEGVWYSFTGTGDDVILSTCNQASYDSKISVFNGGCAALQCVAGNDDGPACGTTSQVLFSTQVGVDYLVLIHGYNGDTGDFTLSMLCLPPCTPAIANDDCASATAIAPQPYASCVPLAATNSCAYGSALPNPPCDEFANIADVWYSFNTAWNTDFTVTLDLLGAPLLNMALYEDCSTPTYIDCFTEVVAPVDLTGLDTNTTYLIRVWNGGVDDAGTFTICIGSDLQIGINENDEDPWSFTPTFFSDAIVITGVEGGDRCAVIDAQGRILIDALANGKPLPAADLAPGSYQLLLQRGNVRTVKRVVKVAAE